MMQIDDPTYTHLSNVGTSDVWAASNIRLSPSSRAWELSGTQCVKLPSHSIFAILFYFMSNRIYIVKFEFFSVIQLI